MYNWFIRAHFLRGRFVKSNIMFISLYLVHSCTAKWIWDSFILSLIKPKLDMGLFVDFCVFTCFYQFLHDVLIKLFCLDLQNNKQSHVKFWLNWRKYRTVSYSFSCTYTIIFIKRFLFNFCLIHVIRTRDAEKKLKFGFSLI